MMIGTDPLSTAVGALCSTCGLRPRYVTPSTGKCKTRCKACLNQAAAERGKALRSGGNCYCGRGTLPGLSECEQCWVRSRLRAACATRVNGKLTRRRIEQAEVLRHLTTLQNLEVCPLSGLPIAAGQAAVAHAIPLVHQGKHPERDLLGEWNVCWVHPAIARMQGALTLEELRRLVVDLARSVRAKAATDQKPNAATAASCWQTA